MDKKTGFRTKQVLTYPIVAENKYLMGVIQLLNKRTGSKFTRKDEEYAGEIAKALGASLHSHRTRSKKPPAKFDYLLTTARISQNDLDNGRLVCKVGVAPLRPAEFVIFRIGQWTADRRG